MGERRNYIALDWVTAEIEETLKQARQSLEEFVADREDLTKLRFCLTYAHQVHGSLKMVELHGAAILAEEVEHLAQALVNGKVADDSRAIEALMAGLLQLSAYIHRLVTTRQDQPAKLLPTLNELRVARGEEPLSEAAVFNPDVTTAENLGPVSKPTIAHDEFNELIRKLRQHYQKAMINVVRDQDLAESYSTFAKICARLYKVAANTQSAALWKIAYAIMQSLESECEVASVNTKTVLRQIDSELKSLQESGRDALENRPSAALLKSLLYTVAKAKPSTELIQQVQDEYRLRDALPELDSKDEVNIALPDSDAVRSVISALGEELAEIQDILDMQARGEQSPEFDLTSALAIFHRVTNTLSVLGAVDALRIVREQQQRIEDVIADGVEDKQTALVEIAAQIVAVQDALSLSESINDARELNIATHQIDQAHNTVIREARNGLEQAKDAIVDFVASQWNKETLTIVPQLLAEVYGGLSMVPLDRAAAVLRSCERYVKEQLLAGATPDWQLLDALADAVSGVEYYLECLSGDSQAELDSILDMAEESATALGYPVKLAAVGSAKHEVASGDTVSVPGHIHDDGVSEEQTDAGNAMPVSHDRDRLSAEVIDLHARQKDRLGEETAARTKSDEEHAAEDALASEEISLDETLPVIDDVASAEEISLPEEESASADEDILSVGEETVSTDEETVFIEEDELPLSEETVSLDEDTASVDEDQLSVSEETLSMAEETPAAHEEAPAVEEPVSDELDTTAEEAVDEDDDVIDEEIIEIFVEEAAEVLETIEEFFPKWKANLDDADAMGEVRRAFHTLKGSGRMVGATNVGELAWAVENMLNRVIEGTHTMTPARLQIVDTAYHIVPPLVEAFEKRTPADTAHAEFIMHHADRLAKGEELDSLPEFTGAVEETPASEDVQAVEETPVIEEPLVAAPVAEEPAIEEPVFEEPIAEEPVIEEAAQEEAHISGLEAAAERFDNEVSSDVALLEIFVAETEAHIEAVKEYLDKVAGQDSVELTEELQRALHTLKGSAHMAEITPIANVVSPVEKLVKELRGCHLQADSAVIAAIDQCIELINQGLAQLTSTPLAELPGTEEFVASVQLLHQERLAEVGKAEEEESAVVDKAAIMLIDGMEKLLHAADLVTKWAGNAADITGVNELIADLRNVEAVAKESGYSPIASISAGLADLYGRVLEIRPNLDQAFFDMAVKGHESLIDMMDVIAAGQGVSAKNELLAELQQACDALTPAPLEEESEVEQAPELEAAAVEQAPVAESATEAETASQGDDAKAAVANIVDNIDEETLEIFIEEAGDLIDEIDTAVNEWLNDHSQLNYADDLMRTLHTLKGGARLAGITPLGDLSHAYETFLEKASDHDETFFAELSSYQDRLHGMVEAVLRGEYEKLVSLGGDAAELLELPVFETSKTEEVVSLDEDYDPEVIEIFFEEARELQDTIENRIHRWMDEREDLSHLEELKRLLHTLKGGARLAGMKALGNLSHNFETMLINSERQTDIAGDEFFAQVQNYQDQLSASLDEIDRVVNEAQSAPPAAAGGQPPQDEQQETAAPAVASEETGDAAREFASDSASDTAPDSASEPARDTARDTTSNVVPLIPESNVNLPAQPEVEVPLAAVEAARAFIDNFEKEKDKARGPQEVVKVPALLLQDLVNLAGETSISRGRVEEQISEAGTAIDEMEATIDRLKGQLRRLEIETEAQIIFRQEQVESEGAEGFDPLEMDRYSHMQQLARSLIESASDLQDVKETFHNKIRDMETLLLQQSRINTELQEGLMRSQMVPFSRMVPRLRRIVRQVSGELGKQVDLRLENVEGELDRTVLERMVAPLEHMLRNAVDHGIEAKDVRAANGKPEQGTITLGLRREGGEVVIDLSDDGGGINLDAVKKKATERGLMDKSASLTDHEILQFILTAGFSTATTVTQISGRGVGMDVVHSEIKQLGGSMDIQSAQGRGSTFTVRLPFTVSVNRALMVVIDNDTYAIPLNTIEGIVRVSPYELEAYYQPDAPPFEYAGQSYQLRYMGSLLHTGARPKLEGQTMPLPVILVRGSEHTVAVQVDRLLGSREIVVKTMGPQFSMVEGLSGATVMGDGSVVVILDLLALIRADISRGVQLALTGEESAAKKQEDRNLLVMVVDDSVTVRKVTSRFLERQGVDVLLAKDGVDAVQKLAEIDVLPDVMLLDIEMPRMDGFEVASRVKHSDRLKEIPIIMITSRTGEKHRDRAFSLGVNRYMGKPYQEAELLNTIKELTGVDNF